MAQQDGRDPPVGQSSRETSEALWPISSVAPALPCCEFIGPLARRQTGKCIDLLPFLEDLASSQP